MVEGEGEEVMVGQVVTAIMTWRVLPTSALADRPHPRYHRNYRNYHKFLGPKCIVLIAVVVLVVVEVGGFRRVSVTMLPKITIWGQRVCGEGGRTWNPPPPNDLRRATVALDRHPTTNLRHMERIEMTVNSQGWVEVGVGPHGCYPHLRSRHRPR